MRDRLDELDRAAVAVVTFADPTRLASHRDQLDLPFPLLADPDRSIYRRFALGRGPLLRIYGPATLRMYAGLLRQGRRFRRPTEDTLQLGGDFVIGPDGRLAAQFRPAGPDDRAPVDTIVAAVVDAAGRSG